MRPPPGASNVYKHEWTQQECHLTTGWRLVNFLRYINARFLRFSEHNTLKTAALEHLTVPLKGPNLTGQNSALATVCFLNINGKTRVTVALNETLGPGAGGCRSFPLFPGLSQVPQTPPGVQKESRTARSCGEN